MPIKTATPSRLFRQTKISESFQRSKVGESSSKGLKSYLLSKSSASSSPSLAKGKAPVVRFEDENLKPEGGVGDSGEGLQAPLSSSDSSEGEEEDQEDQEEEEEEEDFYGDLDEDIGLEDARGESVDTSQSYATANETLNPTPNPQPPNEDDLAEDGPRKTARTRYNTSPSKHLLVPEAMNAPQTSFTSTASTTVDTPSFILGQLDIKSTAARERLAKQDAYDSVDPVSFPDLRPYLNLKKISPFPTISNTASSSTSTFRTPGTVVPSSVRGNAGTSSNSASAFKIPSNDPNNPMGPRTGTSSNGTSSNMRPPPPPPTGQSLPNGTSFPTTPNQKYAGIPGTPGSRPGDDVLDVTDDIFRVLQKENVKLTEAGSAKIKELLQIMVWKQRGYIKSRQILRDQLARQKTPEHSWNGISHTSSSMPGSQSQSTPSPSPIGTGSQSLSRDEKEDWKQQVENLKKMVRDAERSANLNKDHLIVYQKNQDKLQKKIEDLEDQVYELKDVETENKFLEERIRALKDVKMENELLEERIGELKDVEMENELLKRDMKNIQLELDVFSSRVGAQVEG